MSYYKMPVAEYVYPKHFQEMNINQDIYLSFTNKKNTHDKFMFVYDSLKQYDWLPEKIGDFIKLSQAHRRWRKHLKKKLKYLKIFINMDCSTAKKNNDTSDLYRSRGNDEFKCKNYEKSLKLYTQGMMFAEIDSPNFALSMANISAALYYLEEYSHCLKCVDQVLTSKKYPLPNKIFMLFERKGNCYRHMNYQTLAIEMFSKCLLHLDSATQLPLSEKVKIQFRISKYKQMNEELETETNKTEMKYISFSGYKNDQNSVQLSFVEIDYSKEMGKGLFVTKDIKPGEILIIEKPFAGVFKNNMWIFNCNYCFRRCLSAIPCSKCSRVLFCDETCLQKALDSYHGIECSLVYPLKGDPTVEPTNDLALRCFLQLVNAMGIDRYCSMVREYNNINNKSKIIPNENNEYFMDAFRSIYALDGNETKRSVPNLFFMHCTASMMVSLLLLNGYDIQPDLLGNVGESLVHLLCIANLNSYASIELPKYIGDGNNNDFKIDTSETFNTVALVLCSAYSLLNHSCDPNVIVQTYDGIQVTRALQSISKGSQLFTDYGVNFVSHNKEERNKHLFDQYKFSCQCQACTNNWAEYTSLELNELCTGNTSHLNADNQYGIPKSSLAKFNDIVHLLSTQHKIDVNYLDFLFSFLDLLDSNFKKPCTIYYKCIQVIQECLYYTSDQFQLCNIK